MIRPSPNELERLRNEEIAKRRLMRLKEVREYSKANASKLRNLYKEHKLQVINKLAQTIQDQFNLEDSKKLNELKLKHSVQVNAVGNGHDNAADWVDPSIKTNEQLAINLAFADKRHQMALKELQEKKKEKENIETARLKTMQLAMLIEKERAAEIANLPPPDTPLYLKESVINPEDMTPRVKVCDRNKFSVIESFENASYNVQRMNSDDQIFNFDADNAKSAAEFRQNEMIKMSTNLHVQAEEQFIKAHLRGHKAIKKQLVHKDYQELVSDLEHVAKGEMAKRQREYHKNELIGPNSAGHFGVGHNAAKMMFKEKCRERAVEAVVMESLKDITNSEKQNNKLLQSEIVIDNSYTKPQHKLSCLYDKIRKQKENVHFQDEVSQLPLEVAVVDEEKKRISVENNKQNFVSSQDFRELQPNDVTCDLDAEESSNIIRHALSATGRSNIVLEKSTRQKERHHLEDDFLQIDKRFDQLSTNFHEWRDATSVRSESTIEINSQNHHIHNSIGIQESEAHSIGSRSEDTRESNSITKIRDFQRRAIMKLNGQLNTTQIATLEKQIANFSVDSNSITESFSNSLKSYTESNHSESKHSRSVVNEWVNSQLLQTVDKIPDWVTRATPKFIPDLNLSFERSIISIRSNDSSMRSVSSNLSSNTIASRKSSCNCPVHPSLTDISNEQNDYSESKHYLQSSKELLTSFDSKPIGNDSNNILLDDIMNENSLSIPPDEADRDLIDFQNTDDLSFSQDSKSNFMNILEPQILEINTLGNYIDDATESNDNEITTILNLSNSNEAFYTADNICDSANNASLSEIASGAVMTASEITNASNANAELIINEYKRFLDNIAFKIDDSMLDKSEIKTGMLNIIPDEHESIDSFYSRDNPDAMNSVKKTQLLMKSGPPSDICSRIADNTSTGEMASPPQHNNEMDNSNNNKFLSLSELSENTSLNSESNDLQLDKEENETRNVDQLLPSACTANHGTISSGINQSYFALESIGAPFSNNHDSLSSDTDQLVSMFSMDSNANTNLQLHNEPIKKIPNILSSTMKANKTHVFPSSPDVSSIHSESSVLLKQQIMKDYFEKNKERLQEVLHPSNSTQTASSKPTDFVDDETPRNPDSGKASSRYTTEHSGQSTERMGNDDILMTGRNDSLLTEYTVRDQWSSSHSNFQTLSELISLQQNDNLNRPEENEKMFHNSYNFNSKTSVDLIDFNSNMDLHDVPTSYSTTVPPVCSQDLSGSNLEHHQATPTSQKLSTLSNILSPYDRNLIDNNLYSDKSTTDCNSSPYKCLESIHSSEELDFNDLSTEQVHEFETILQFEDKTDINCSIDSKSEADMSTLSLVSFLRNESACQEQFTASNREISSESTPKKTTTKTNIENNQEMKIQLEKWKKERLQRINNNPPNEIKKSHITKDDNMRRKDIVETKSRTTKLWNQLEEVQKMKQRKEAEKIKLDNQLRKKEYAEKLRRIKMEKQKKVEKL